MKTQVRIIDLCGRKQPVVTDLAYCDEQFGRDGTDHILDQFAEGKTSAFIGEWEIQEVKL